MTRILAVSGTRADWGLLAPVLTLIREAQDFELVLAVTGQHLLGNTTSLAQIESEGFTIDYKIELDLASDSRRAVTHAMSQALAGFADVLDQSKPDLMLVLGDRYEIHSAATAALIANTPIAHMCGGDVTEGAVDDTLRHSITKMAHLHFVTNEQAERRVAQLGEDPAHIHNVGSTGIDRIREIETLDRTSFFERIGIEPQHKNLLIAFHPVTLSDNSMEQCQAMLDAVSNLSKPGLIITGTNADAENLAINNALRAFAEQNCNAVFQQSLGSQLFFSAMTHCDAIVGNSSSGLYEAPTFQLPTVNIGERQKGRLRAQSVIDCMPDQSAIYKAIVDAFALDFTQIRNPYGDGRSAPRILNILKNVGKTDRLATKSFVDVT